MLEKFGLPAKPAMRGGNWVVDASHCQGCSSQFTFINRKHHCRRCGGLFCNSCTQQRMILRGQGDSPVRICDPCKKLEDAARFELRYGHRNRAMKGSSKEVSKNEDEAHSNKNNEEELLNQILGNNGKKPKLSENGLDMVSDLYRITSGTSGSTVRDDSTTFATTAHNDALNASDSTSPEELRQQAVEEKSKYKILKGEGKAEQALQAFKRGKDLERQAAALEITLRKNRRIALKASSSGGVTDTKKMDDSEEPSNKKKFPSLRGSDEKDNLAAELRGLGWSDADLHSADKKPANVSLDGELANLLREIPRKSSHGRGTVSIDKAQVIAHKKQALLFKREGKLAEAKEELKKAKVLEKQIEEQELLGEAEESDDELSALIRSMDDEKQDDLLLDRGYDPGINIDHLLSVPDDFAFDGNLEVTDDDLNDPELGAALKSFGWTEGEDEHEDDHVMQSVPLDYEALKGQVLTLKREALSQKRAGNVSEAMALLKKAKLLEKDLEGMQSDTQTCASESTKSSTSQVFEKSFATAANVETSYSKTPAKNRLVIQRELLSIKKKALTLRREGKIEEAEEQLKKGKVLEQQLEEMENALKRPITAEVGKKILETSHKIDDESETLDLGEDKVDAEVTDQDMNDPSLLSVLKNLGWQDEESVSVTATSKISEKINDQSTYDNGSSLMPPKTMKSKSEIQKELLSIKRKSLALRRQGKTEEAEEELKRAKTLEDQLADIEASNNASSILVESHHFGSLVPQKKSNPPPTGNVLKSDVDVPSSVIDRSPKYEEITTKEVSNSGPDSGSEAKITSLPGFIALPQAVGIEPHLVAKQELPAEKNSVVQVFGSFQSGCSSNGIDVLFGGEELVHRKNLDTRAHSSVSARTNQISAKENTSSDNEDFSHIVLSSQIIDENEPPVTATSISVIPEFCVSQGTDVHRDEILAHKRKAVALKREGKLAEAKEELRQAKLLEKGLERTQQAGKGSRTAQVSASDRVPVILETKTHQAQKPVSGRDRFKLQQESLAHKRNALKLRREGKIEESEAEFELAKALESQLEDISTQGSSAKVGASDDFFVEDLLDPQLISSLKSIGWGDADFVTQSSKKAESLVIMDEDGKSSPEKGQLEEQIKNEKLRALNFKRAGKQVEALEALRAAKRLEKKLESSS